MDDTDFVPSFLVDDGNSRRRRRKQTTNNAPHDRNASQGESKSLKPVQSDFPWQPQDSPGPIRNDVFVQETLCKN